MQAEVKNYPNLTLFEDGVHVGMKSEYHKGIRDGQWEQVGERSDHSQRRTLQVQGSGFIHGDVSERRLPRRSLECSSRSFLRSLLHSIRT